MDQRRLVFGVIPSIHEVPQRDPSRGENDRVPNGIVIPEMTRGINRSILRTWITEETSTHARGLDPYRR
ncbi:hypothetical protein B296_00056823 [Ensete ventricosum]|uniref:Uncharacterized protein n=1 Tax=Ensete ventricosum TaxID=4639 RepID=A0A426XD89_ENSVE|nr:hypothetical protein B296_00056823 [Ensete ventricosum]